ncbi:trigger factor-related chaperone [Mycoplasmopsis cricetuli]|uniref:trigger factor-related chaperone n=1 Tax=Mycoplasmopsis cricetuli TaxID=171283 RepID=UPI000472FB21|nr:hypothetical protein [Mycoplasmopsis cricetuli]
MKELFEKITIDKQKWIQAQNEALNNLQAQSKTDPNIKINQQMIWQNASREIIRNKHDSIWKKYLEQDEISAIYLRPITIIDKISSEELDLNFKIYYFDEFDKYNFDITPNAKLKFPENHNQMIDDFINNFVKSYKFRKVLPAEMKIQQGHLVYLNVTNQNNQTNSLVIKMGTDPNNPLEQNLLNKYNHDKFESEFLNQKWNLEITEAFYFEEKEITDDNANEIMGKNFKNLKQVKDEIELTTREQIYSNALYEYGTNILKQIVEKSPKPNIPQDLIAHEIEEYKKQFGPKPSNQEIEKNVIGAILDYFWQILLKNKFKLNFSEDEFKKEVAFAQGFLPEESRHQIQPQAIARSLLIKKIALTYLKQYESEIFEKNKKYTFIEI